MPALHRRWNEVHPVLTSVLLSDLENGWKCHHDDDGDNDADDDDGDKDGDGDDDDDNDEDCHGAILIYIIIINVIINTDYLTFTIICQI